MIPEKLKKILTIIFYDRLKELNLTADEVEIFDMGNGFHGRITSSPDYYVVFYTIKANSRNVSKRVEISSVDIFVYLIDEIDKLNQKVFGNTK